MAAGLRGAGEGGGTCLGEGQRPVKNYHATLTKDRRVWVPSSSGPPRFPSREPAEIDTEAFRQQIKEWGATLVGFGDVSVGLASELAHLPVAISLAVPHRDVRKNIRRNGKTRAYVHQDSEAVALLEAVEVKVVRYLRWMGYRFVAIPPDSGKVDPRFIARIFHLFSHKTAATCSGLGWIGRSGLLINPNYGPFMSWATVLTNAPLVVDPPMLKSRCGECRACTYACPTQALKGICWEMAHPDRPMVDYSECIQQLEKNIKVFGEFVCGSCLLVCPAGFAHMLGRAKVCPPVNYIGLDTEDE